MIFLLFVLVPLVELALLIQVGQWIGAFETIMLVFLTGIVGAWLARREGLRALRRVQRDIAENGLPGTAALDALAVLVGGAFLLTPGVLTDLVGFALLFPPTRALARRAAVREIMKRVQDGRIQVHLGGFGAYYGSGAAGGPGSGMDGGDDSGPLDPRYEIRPEDDDPVS
jgi:UPF0716 protein FxsA